MPQENQNVEMVNLQDLLKEVRQPEEVNTEINPEEVLSKFTKVVDEFKEEEKEEEIVEEEKTTVNKTSTVSEIKPTSTVNQYTQKLKDYIADGFIEDFQITVGEGEDAKEVFLSDLEDLDKETFDFIKSKYKEVKDSELKDKYISKEGLDDRTLKLVDLKKKGGNISELIEAEVQYVNPVSQFDLTNEKDQERLVRQSLQSQGIRESIINATIQEMKADLTLDSEAEKIYQEVNTRFDNFVEQKRQEQLALIEKEQEEIKELKKVANSKLKEFNLKESIHKTVLENITKRDENGLTNTDKLYFDLQNDPEKLIEIGLFLNNREAFIKHITTPVANEAIKKNMKSMFTINPSVVKQKQSPEIHKNKGDEIFEKITAKFNT